MNNPTDGKPGIVARRIGLIAGNGRLPLLVLQESVKVGLSVVVAAIREETSPEVERFTGPEKGRDVRVHWMGLGQLGKLIRTFKKEGIRQAIMAGQVKHVQIFAPGSSVSRQLLTAMPDLRMIRLLISLPHKSTSALIGGIASVLAEEGIELLDSTILLGHLLPDAGTLTGRLLTEEEQRDIDFGWKLARDLAALDIGQTLVVKNQAVVAVEAMEGTDETIRRAAGLVEGQSLRVVKVARPNQDMRFDVPVIGLQTVQTLKTCRVSAMAIEAKKTLVLDRSELVRQADECGIAIVAR